MAYKAGDLISQTELARWYGVAKSTITFWNEEFQLPYTKHGNRNMYDPREVIAHISGTVYTKATAKPKSSETDSYTQLQEKYRTVILETKMNKDLGKYVLVTDVEQGLNQIVTSIATEHANVINQILGRITTEDPESVIRSELDNVLNNIADNMEDISLTDEQRDAEEQEAFVKNVVGGANV